jgi:Arp2/3 complex, 34 kD subunit p34-Arc.
MVSPARIVQQYPRHHPPPRAGDLDTFLRISCRHDGIYQISRKYLATAEENYDEGNLIAIAGGAADDEYRSYWTISKSAAGCCSSTSTTTYIRSKTSKNHEEKNHEITTITGHEQYQEDQHDNNRNKKGELFVNNEKKNYIMMKQEESNKENKEEQQEDEQPIMVVDEVLFDFGIKYRIIVIQEEQMRRGRGGNNTAEGEDNSRSTSNNMKDNSSSRKEGHYCYTIFMHMNFFGWDVIGKRATKNLMEIFGEENVFTAPSNKSSTTTNDHEQEFRLLMHSVVAPGHDICIKINSAALPENQDVESTCNCMSNIRIIVLGNDLKLALQSIARRPASNHFLFHSRGNLSKNDAKVEQNQQQQKHEEKRGVESAAAASSAPDHEDDDKSSKSNFVFERQESFAIPIQRPPVLTSSASKPQYMVVVPQNDRVTVVIPFIYHCQNETESAFARVFLQQFEQAQRKCLNERNGKNVPICEYRRSNDPPREMKLFQERKELLNEEAAKELNHRPRASMLSITLDTSH